MTRGLVLAAPASGSGKTTLTLGLLRAFSRAGQQTRGAKSGPDYIDPRFHEAACRQPCVTLDAWAMQKNRLRALAAGPGLLLVEGAMGLFDGAPPDGKGATADVAKTLGLPVILVVDAGRMSHSVAALVGGFASFDPHIRIAGVILNNVGSPRHEQMLRDALADGHVPVLGAIARQSDLAHPSRHLGLVQASERADLDGYLDRVADVVEGAVDLPALVALAQPVAAADDNHPRLSPPAQKIAIAADQAFAFAYPHLLADWRDAGAELGFFSPLADEVPPAGDLIILPGGYPELFAGQLSAATNFRAALQDRAKTTAIYGECGGYMTLGKTLQDNTGTTHEMVGLLDLHTSFAHRKLHLGYRHLTPLAGPFKHPMMGHEFHYATTISAQGQPLFKATDATQTQRFEMGLVAGRVSGSFAHVIDAA